MQEVMDETAWKLTRGREEDAWRLEPEGETKMPETRVVSDGVDGIYVDLDGEGYHDWGQVNSRRQSDAPGEEGQYIKSPKRERDNSGERNKEHGSGGSGRIEFRTECDHCSTKADVSL